MCQNKRWITNKYDGRRYLVNCGHCPSCLQQKAVMRTNRIRYNYDSLGTNVALFVTLTYRNGCIPYIRLSDLERSVPQFNLGFSSLPHKCEMYREVPIYRDSKVRWNRYSSSYDVQRCTTDMVHILDSVKFPSHYEFNDLKRLRGQVDDKVGVIYKKDLQNFIKRLKQNLSRHYNYEKPISYFSCSEYGPTSSRPHFHLLIWCESSCYKDFTSAIVESWSYDDYHRTRENISIAKNAASYVSSYVNCDSSLSPILKSVRQTSPSHSYSQGFGTALDFFSLPKIFEAFKRGDLTCVVSRLRNGTLVNDTIILPKYVIHRYFPKFKGFNRLVASEIQQLVHDRSISETSRLSRQLEWTKDQMRSITIMLHNKVKYAQSLGISVYDYADMYAHIYDTYASNQLRVNYLNVSSPIQNFYAYDNINDYFSQCVESPSLDSLATFLPDEGIIRDPNRFPANVLKDFNLRQAFNSYSKDRKVRNYIYSQSFNV